ncbi:MAG TPA: DUF2294 domain-containing protein [Leptolyngbyaceae cyanobacterium]
MPQKIEQPTAGQLERELAQKIQALYRSQLEHQPSKVICQLLNDKLTIVIEDAVTQPEKLLSDNGSDDLVEQFRSRIDEIIQPQLKVLIEETLKAQVIDLLSDITLGTGRGGMIVILDHPPDLRSTLPISKAKSVASR